MEPLIGTFHDMATDEIIERELTKEEIDALQTLDSPWPAE